MNTIVSDTSAREALVRTMYDAWPHTVISGRMVEAIGLPLGTVLTFDVAKQAGADFSGLERYADAILASLPSPEGEWVLVPREPTEAMIEAVGNVASPLTNAVRRAHAGPIWSAMLSATPSSDGERG